MKNIFSIIIIALSLGLGFFYAKPEYDKISVLREQKSAYEDALSKAKQLRTLRDSLIADYSSISDADKTKLAHIIPVALDPVKLTSDMNVVASNHSLFLHDVKVSDANTSADSSRTDVLATNESKPYSVTSISFVTSGQYPNFVAFLRDLESSVQLIDIKKLSISVSRQSSGILDFQSIIDTYSVNTMNNSSTQ